MENFDLLEEAVIEANALFDYYERIYNEKWVVVIEENPNTQ